MDIDEVMEMLDEAKNFVMDMNGPHGEKSDLLERLNSIQDDIENYYEDHAEEDEDDGDADDEDDEF